MHRKWLRALFHRRLIVSLMILLQIGFLVYLVIDSSRISTAISFTLRFISIAVALYIVSKRDKRAFKLTWVFLILLFPLFGGLLYLLFHVQIELSPLNYGAKKIEKKARPIYYLPGDGYQNAALAMPHAMPQIRYLQHFAGFPIYDDTETQYFPSGEEKWAALLNELQQAERYVFLEYFIIAEGRMWFEILEILKQKAAQGVLVRILYDDFGCFFKLPKDYPAQLKQYGIECAIFNPFQPLFSAHQNNRDHRKIAVIDGKVAFTGGVNLADEYINDVERFGHWKDAAILLRGKGAWSLTLMFLQNWELCQKKPEDFYAFAPNFENSRAKAACGFVQPYCDSPMDRENVGEHVYLQIIEAARDYLYITTPYLIIDDSMISALALAAKSGVDVRIMTPHIADKIIIHATTRSYYRELILAGVHIYEYERGFVHAKTFVSDNKTATVGTTNLDFRSLYLHFECGVLLYDCPSIFDIKHDFQNTLSHCHEITLKDCSRSVLGGLVQDILRLFAPLM